MEKYVDIDIKQTGLVTHSRGYWESRVFTDYNFWLILNGEIDLKVEESVYRLIQGDIIFFFPGAEYECTFLERSLIRFNHFVLHRDGKTGVINRSPECIHLSQPENFNLLVETGEKWDLKNGWGRIFFTAAIAGLFKELEDVNKPLKTSMYPEDRFLYDLDQYIQDHISESLSVGSIAGNFGKSSNYFSDLVRKLSGESLGNRVRKLKMRRAMILLKKTDMKVYEIAQSLGYSDSYSFSKAFKVFQGESPVSFKRENG